MDEVRIDFSKFKRVERPLFGSPEGNAYYDKVIEEINDKQLNRISRIRYETPSNYTNPKCFLRFIAKYLQEISRGLEYNDKEIHAMSSVLVGDLLKYDVPFYLISKDIFIALLNTDPPEESWILESNPIPFPAVGFLFPHDELIIDTEKNISIDWAILGSFKFPEGHNRLLSIANDKTNKCFLLSSIHENNALSDTIPVTTALKDKEPALYEIENVNNVMQTLYNIVTLMNQCPEYIDNKTIRKEVKAKRPSEQPKIFSTCRTIGRNFRIAYNNSGNAVPTGKTMPVHQRRGHWHHILKGRRKDNEGNKIAPKDRIAEKRWFKPVWINV